MAGFENDVLVASNLNFDDAAGPPHLAIITAAGMLPIGTGNLSPIPEILGGSLTSPNGTITIGYSSPNITLDTAGSIATQYIENVGSAIPAAGLLNVLARYTNSTIGAGNTITITPTVRGYPITPFVVGPSTFAGYQTIQSALDAANLAGGGMVWVQPGTYTENLTFYSGIQLSSPSEQSVTIVGIHTPPASGTLNIDRLTFQSATHIFSSAAAGTTTIIMEDCSVNVTNGYTFNLPNWAPAGSVSVFNIGNIGTNDGFFNNTGGASFFAYAAGIGNGTVNTLTISGISIFANQIIVGCPVNLVTGASFASYGSAYSHTFTCSNNSIASFTGDNFSTGATPALTMSSSGAVTLTHCLINSSNNPAITGAGAGTLTYSDISFLNNSSFAGTLTLATVSWRPYSIALAASDGTKVGTCNFNSAQFTVDTAGFVSITNGLFTWVDQAGTFTAAKNTGYFITGTATANLPAAPAQGDTIKFFVDHASQFLTIDAPGTQIIRLGSLVTSAGGTATSTLQGDSVELTYRASDTCWCSIAGFEGTWLIA